MVGGRVGFETGQVGRVVGLGSDSGPGTGSLSCDVIRSHVCLDY